MNRRQVNLLLQSVRDCNRELRVLCEHYGVFVPAPELGSCVVYLRSGNTPTGYEKATVSLVPSVFCYSLHIQGSRGNLTGLSHVILPEAADEALDFFVDLVSRDNLRALYEWLLQVRSHMEKVVASVPELHRRRFSPTGGGRLSRLWTTFSGAIRRSFGRRPVRRSR